MGEKVINSNTVRGTKETHKVRVVRNCLATNYLNSLYIVFLFPEAVIAPVGEQEQQQKKEEAVKKC